MTFTHFNRRQALALTAGAAASVALPALAQDKFPSRPITLIAPWPAGGSSDAVMRAFAESASRVLGVSVVIDNKPGAGGTLGATAMVNAKPDGYLLTQLPLGIYRLPHMQQMAFDPVKDITHIACLTGYTFGIVVRSDSPIKSIKDLVEYAKANPEKFTYGTPGAGTTPHLAVEEFAAKAGIKLSHIPYKGAAEGVQAVLGGHVMSHSDSTGWAPQVDAGNLRLLATYGSKRAKRYPNVPTLNELGYETISDSPFGIGAPRGMDPALTRRLHDAFKKTLEDPAVLATFDKYDQSVIYMNTADYTKFIAEQYVKEKAVIERLGLGVKA